MESESEAKVSSMEKENLKLKSENKLLNEKLSKLNREVTSLSQIRTGSKERVSKESIEDLKSSHQSNMVDPLLSSATTSKVSAAPSRARSRPTASKAAEPARASTRPPSNTTTRRRLPASPCVASNTRTTTAPRTRRP